MTAVLHRIEVPSDNLAFIIMEEWSSHLDTDPPDTIKGFFGIIRQHLEASSFMTIIVLLSPLLIPAFAQHVAFMHAHRLAHLDLNVRNAMIDGHRYACIDYETSRRFQEDHPRILGVRSCDPPPEVNRDGCWDPYKADVWASGMFILRVLQVRKPVRYRFRRNLNAVAPVNWASDTGTASIRYETTRRRSRSASHSSTGLGFVQWHLLN